MIIGQKVLVSASFDSGTFLNFGVNAISDSYDHSDNSIQDRYNLSYNDFRVLEMMICNTVEKYLEAKEKKDIK